MTAVISGGAPQDLIAYSWFVMGFRPRESLVVVGLTAPSTGDCPPVSTTGCVARLDLPAVEHAAAAATAFADLLGRAGDEACLLLTVSDLDGDDDLLDVCAGMTHAEVTGRVTAGLVAAGVQVVDAILVGAGAFRSYLCDDVQCCPAAGTSLSTVTDSQVAAAMVLAGRCVLDSERALVADVDPAAAADRGEPVLVPGNGRPGQARRRAAFRRWCADLDAGATVPTEPAELLAALADPGLRDAVLMSLVPGGRAAAAALARGHRPERLWPDQRVRPDADLVRTGAYLLGALARRAAPESRAEPLAALAWLAWWSGDAVRGRLLAELALDDLPGHRLAALVTALLEVPVPPGWVETGSGPVRPAGRQIGAGDTPQAGW